MHHKHKPTEAKSVYKAPGEKLLRVHLWYDDRQMTVSRIKLSGDFFIHPEKELESIENILRGMPIEELRISEQIQGYLETTDLQMYGISPRGIAQAILRCITINEDD